MNLNGRAVNDSEDSEGMTVKHLSGVIGAVFAGLFLFYAVMGNYESYQHRTIFITFCLVLAFLTIPAFGNGRRGPAAWILDGGLICASIAVGAYGALQNYDILIREGDPLQSDIVVGAIMMLLILEGTRRTVGLALMLIAMSFLAYVYLGPTLPPFMAHAGYGFEYIIASNYMSDQGIYGVILGVTADFIFLFILFGALLEKAGAVNEFNNLSQSLVGTQTGGPAKTAVFASGIMGSVSGSAVANVVTTGTFTIPLMRRMGYPPEFAGAVEASASTGGQFMPPIMGASAFIIAATLGVAYLDVVVAAAVPAVLYFFSVGMAVHFMSKKLGLKGLPREELPPFRPAFFKSLPLILPLVVILGMLTQGFSVITAGLVSIISVVLLSWARKETRLGPKRLLEALGSAGTNIIGVGLACATAGMIANSIAISGVGMRISSVTIMMSEVSLLAALVFSMFASLILGMGMPTVAAYVIVSTLGAPALVGLGLPEMATHLFVFFFAIMCNVTPPVALAAYAAAPLAGLSQGAWKVGIEAFKLAMPGFIIPYFFIFNTHLLLEGDVLDIVLAVSTAVLGVIAISAASMGFFRARCGWAVRLTLFSAALGLLTHEWMLNVAALCVMAGVYFIQYRLDDQLPEQVGK